MKSKLASIFILIVGFYILILSLPTQVIAASAQGSCPNENEVETALGCISTTAEGNGFFGNLINIAVGLGGGFALLLMLYGVFIVTTSAGIPDKLKEGKEIITSAISGLIFIVLSVVLLNLIGVKILAIPGL